MTNWREWPVEQAQNMRQVANDFLDEFIEFALI
jgi:hypothetical protein